MQRPGDFYTDWQSLKPLPENKNAVKLGFSVGDLFVVACTTHNSFKAGTIVVLEEDDKSEAPKFSDGTRKEFCFFYRLSPLQKTSPSISSSKFTMAKVQSFIERMLDADKRLIHKYFINGDNLLNEVGIAEVLNFLAFENKEVYAYLVKRAQERKAEEEKK